MRASGAENCPQEDELRRAVAGRVGYDPFFPHAARTVVVQIEPEGAKFRGLLRVLGPDGTLVGERQIPSATTDCGELVKSLALAVSLALDELPEPPQAPPGSEPSDLSGSPERPPPPKEEERSRSPSAAPQQPLLQERALKPFREIARLEAMVGARSDYEKNRLVLGFGLRLLGVKKGVFGLTVLEGYVSSTTDDSLFAGSLFYHVGVRPFVELPVTDDGALVAQLGLGVGVSGGGAERVGKDFEGHGLGISPSVHVLYNTRSPVFVGLGIVVTTPALVPIADGDRGGVHGMLSVPVGVTF